MERWMIVYLLPLEVCMDIFCFPWIGLKRFGQIVDMIGNHKFSEHAQFYLHEWGKREITGILDLDKYSTNLNVPQSPLPANIRSFEWIQIFHFDANTLDFLGNIRPLLAGVAIDVSEDHFSYHAKLNNLRTILTILAPMLDGIQSLAFNERTLPMAKQCFGEEKFAQPKMLKYHHGQYGPGEDDMQQQQNVILIMAWLAQPADGPRLCEAHLYNTNTHGIFEQILQQFLTAQTPRTFAMNLHHFYISTLQSVAEFHLENGIGEELHGAYIGRNPNNSEEGTFQITRHRANDNKEEMREWIKENTKWKKNHRLIQLACDNLFTVDAPPPPMDEGKQAEQQQPCSSKQA